MIIIHSAFFTPTKCFITSYILLPFVIGAEFDFSSLNLNKARERERERAHFSLERSCLN